MAFFFSWKGVRRDLRYLDGGHPCHALRLGEAVAGFRDDHVRLADREDLQEGPPRQCQARAAAGAALIGWLGLVWFGCCHFDWLLLTVTSLFCGQATACDFAWLFLSLFGDRDS